MITPMPHSLFDRQLRVSSASSHIDRYTTRKRHKSQMSSRLILKMFHPRVGPEENLPNVDATASTKPIAGRDIEPSNFKLICGMSPIDKFRAVLQKRHTEDSNQQLILGDETVGLYAMGSTQGLGQESSGTENKDPFQTFTLCRSCSGIASTSFEVHSYVLHDNAESLLSASHCCPLCRLVKYQLGRVMTRADLVHVPSSIKLVHKIPGKLWFHAYGLHLGELQFFAHPSEFVDARVPDWLPRGVLTIETGTVATALDMPQAYPRVETEALRLLGKSTQDCFEECGTCFHPRHSSADKLPIPPLLPRRVIDIGDTNGNSSPSVLLHESAKDERAHYTTLSHRWGSKIIFRTTINNITARCNRIDFDSLPTSFKDAIIVTRALDVRYLWVDAICIVQDDRSDWIHQAPLMGKIYKNAYCTIAAHSARNCSDGFLESLSPLNPVEVASFLTRKSGPGSLCIGLPRSFKETIDCSYINQRGWVLQELTLSQRIAHFSNGYLYWDCPHTTTPRSLGHRAEPSIQARPPIKTLGTGAGFAESWMDLVTEYSKCQLTYEKDKLFAISGIAAEWQSRLGEGEGRRYHSGVFECTLPQSLFWFSGGGPLKRLKERAPSWSWASVDGEIQFMNTRTAASVATFEVGANDSSDLVTADNHGCRLKMHTSLRKATIAASPTNFGMETVTEQRYLRPGGVMVKGSQLEIAGNFGGGQASFDDGFKFERSKFARSVLCARVCTQEIKQQKDLLRLDFVLLLESVKSIVARYRRIGVGIIVSEGFFDSAPQQDILVI